MNKENRDKQNLKQLNIEIDKEILIQVKMVCIKRNIPMRTWIYRQLIKGLREEI